MDSGRNKHCRNLGEEITAGNFNALAINFQKVDGTGFQLNDITGDGLKGSDRTATADQIWIWNPLTSDYEKWYLYTDDTHKWDGWWDVLTQTKEFAQIHPEGLSVGSSVWFVSNTKVGGTATFAGAVSPAADVTLSVTKGNFNLFGSPFPVGLQLNNAAQISWVNAMGTDNPKSADQIGIWNAKTSGYEKWYYYNDNGKHPEWTGWWDAMTSEHKFGDVGYHENGLAAGVPVWYVAQGKLGETFDVKFISPLAK